MVLPIFLLIIFGIVDGGRLIFTNNQLSEAAREGARWGSVQGRSTTAAGKDSIKAETISRINVVESPTVTVECGSCRSSEVLVVSVEADFDFATPFLEPLMGAPKLSAQSKVVINQ